MGYHSTIREYCHAPRCGRDGAALIRDERLKARLNLLGGDHWLGGRHLTGAHVGSLNAAFQEFRFEAVWGSWLVDNFGVALYPDVTAAQGRLVGGDFFRMEQRIFWNIHEVAELGIEIDPDVVGF